MQQTSYTYASIVSPNEASWILQLLLEYPYDGLLSIYAFHSLLYISMPLERTEAEIVPHANCVANKLCAWLLYSVKFTTDKGRKEGKGRKNLSEELKKRLEPVLVNPSLPGSTLGNQNQ